MLLLSRRIERPLDVPIERPQHADMRMLNPLLALAVPLGIFRHMPRLILPPFLEVIIAALWQIVSPCPFECHARGLETRRGAVSIVTRLAARIEPAAPLPRIRRR
jgi:hypothetical protein